jgi:DNA-directed RNA polymerase subunit E'/Rpb7
MDIYNISAGKVRPGSGEAHFTILYRAILWKPFKGETVSRTYSIFHARPSDKEFQIDCAVSSIKPQGVFCEAGPLTVFVSKLVCETPKGGIKVMLTVISTYLQTCAIIQMQHLHNTQMELAM